MSGGGENNLGMALRSNKKDTDVEDASCGHEAKAKLGEIVSLASIRDAINETMTKAKSELKNDISIQLSESQSSFQQDIKKQLGEMRTDINQKMEEATRKIEATSQRLEEAERRIGEVETYDLEANKVITQLQETQLQLK
ncbi:Laminin subunit gamma-1 [Dissostichus eleginoides]|uniref:Laminin subunit gamma-1 n=1 Tax=Dissostichus eleginoides TaxID=100907 RepID=A0AAD9C9B3_DISEL|nr:Laminin subunit gamma-1 [Dissostichus eleginoides]